MLQFDRTVAHNAWSANEVVIQSLPLLPFVRRRGEIDLQPRPRLDGDHRELQEIDSRQGPLPFPRGAPMLNCGD